ncbi:MAG: DsrE family protein [Sulfurimicrobium sp.]|nr:DsrE family protein [Sulfurimicrobium sp.]
MLESILRRNAQVGVCGTCLEARGIQDSELIEGAHHSTMDQLAEWTEWADKVLVL